MLINLFVIIFMIAGLVFFTGGTIGIIRFPDFYTRLHAAGKLDTLGSLFVTISLALYNLNHFTLAALLTSLKIMLAVVFVFLAGPTATHAIVDAGVRAGLRPWVKENK